MNNTKRILSKNYTVDNDSYKIGLNGHDMVVAASGAGKTSGYVIPNIVTCEESIIVTDAKGNLYYKLKDLLQAKGYKVELIDLVDAKNSTVFYNPLEWIRQNPDGSFHEQDIRTLAEIIAPKVKDEKDPFWRDMARIIIEASIAATLECLSDEERTMANVFRFAQKLSGDSGRLMLKMMCAVNPDSFLSKKCSEFLYIQNAEKMWESIMAFVHSMVSPISSGIGQAILNTRHGFDVRTLGDEKTALFVNVSDNDRSADRLTDLMYTQFFQNLIRYADKQEDNRLKVPIRLFLDDYACACSIPDFQNLIAILRSRNISVSVILQSITQLYSRYSHEDGNTIINNCDHVIYLGGRDPSTMDYLSKLASCPVEKICNLPLGAVLVCERGKKSMFEEAFTWKEADELIKNEWFKLNQKGLTKGKSKEIDKEREV